MALTAYTSAAVNPLAAQYDHVIDLKAGDAFPPAGGTLQFYGDAVDTVDGGAAVWTWQWALLAKPAGSAASLVDATVQNPVLQNIDVVGNYRLLLVATNTHLPGVTEANPLSAPDTAIVHLRVRSAKYALEKLAPGERNTYPRAVTAGGLLLRGYNALIDEFEGHDISQHDTLATGTQLNVLTGHGVADDPALPGTELHTHNGAAITPATTTALGVVELENAPVDPAVPKVITQERVFLQGTADGTMSATGYKPGIIEPPVAGVCPCHVWWHIREQIEIIEWSIGLSDGGGVPGDYVFDIRKAVTLDDFEGNVWAAVPDTTPVVKSAQIGLDDGGAHINSVAHGPLMLLMLGDGSAPGKNPWVIPAGSYIGVRCTGAPVDRGGGLVVKLEARRKI